MEMLLYMAILGIFLTVLTQVFVDSLNVQLSSEATSSISQGGLFILSRLSYDIARAQSVTVPSSTTLQLTINSVNYTYALSGNTLQLTNDLGTDQINSYDANVSSLSFQKIGNTGGKYTVKINFTLTSKVIQKGISSQTGSFQTTVGLRQVKNSK